MKRIDEKIKEIEKKDKTNRLLFYGIIVLIVGFLFYASTTQKTIDSQKGTIAEQLETIKEQLETEKKLSKQLDDSIHELNRSLKPKEYWKHIKDEGSVEGYIEYLTNIWGIHRDSIDMNTAIADIKKNATIGEDGWVYIGNETENGPYVQPTRGQVVKIVWRRGHEEESEIATIEDTKPNKHDIVKLIKSTNRITYRNSNFNATKNKEGWRPSSKAFIADVRKNDAEVWVQIRYY
jgi:hypothetical protein